MHHRHMIDTLTMASLLTSVTLASGQTRHSSWAQHTPATPPPRTTRCLGSSPLIDLSAVIFVCACVCVRPPVEHFACLRRNQAAAPSVQYQMCDVSERQAKDMHAVFGALHWAASELAAEPLEVLVTFTPRVRA